MLRSLISDHGPHEDPAFYTYMLLYIVTTSCIPVQGKLRVVNPSVHHCKHYFQTQSHTQKMTTPKTASPKKASPKKQHIARRAQALTLHGVGISFAEIKKKTGYSKSSFYELRQKAIGRGYVDGGPVLDEHVIDGKRTGRPTKAAAGKADQQAVNEAVNTTKPFQLEDVQLLARAESSTTSTTAT